MQLKESPASCSRCSKSNRLDEAEYCSCCLAEVVEKRVKKKLDNIAGNNRGQVPDKIFIACGDKKSLSCTAAAYLAKKLRRDSQISITRLPSRATTDNAQVILPQCADDIATNFVKQLTAKASQNKSRNAAAPDAAGAVNILESITEKELELYAAIKKIKYIKAKNTDLKQKMQKLQARYPGTLEALAQSSRRIGKIRLKTD